jgi:hypothetical protein
MAGEDDPCSQTKLQVMLLLHCCTLLQLPTAGQSALSKGKHNPQLRANQHEAGLWPNIKSCFCCLPPANQRDAPSDQTKHQEMLPTASQSQKFHSWGQNKTLSSIAAAAAASKSQIYDQNRTYAK